MVKPRTSREGSSIQSDEAGKLGRFQLLGKNLGTCSTYYSLDMEIKVKSNYLATLTILVCFFSLPGQGQQVPQQPVSLASAARETLVAFEHFRLEQLRTALVEAQYQQALKQEYISEQPFKTQDEAANAMENRPPNQPEDVWKRYVETSIAEWKELGRLNVRVSALKSQIQALEKTLGN